MRLSQHFNIACMHTRVVERTAPLYSFRALSCRHASFWPRILVYGFQYRLNLDNRLNLIYTRPQGTIDMSHIALLPQAGHFEHLHDLHCQVAAKQPAGWSNNLTIEVLTVASSGIWEAGVFVAHSKGSYSGLGLRGSQTSAAVMSCYPEQAGLADDKCHFSQQLLVDNRFCSFKRCK